MTTTRLLTIAALLVLATAALSPGQGPSLTAEDKKLLDGLFKDTLFDPQGAQRVRVQVTMRTVWADTVQAEREGWYLPAAGGKPAQVVFTDGEAIPLPPGKEITKVDFLAACRQRYAPDAKGDTKDDAFGGMKRAALGLGNEGDLALAAWLYRLGQEKLAAQALAQARQGEDKDPRGQLRGALAWSTFAQMIHAYMVRADDEALTHGERLLKRYGDIAEKEYKQARDVVDDLQRRKKAGTFGKTPIAKWPDGADKWDTKKKVAFLIEQLDEVDARQTGQPGGVDLASDTRVLALIELGDVAVPDLIEVIAKDSRLTRSVHFWRDFARSRTVLTVREAALAAVMSILRVSVFDTAEKLRAYWQEYGGLPFDERMMKVLTNPKADSRMAMEAAYNLAHLGQPRTPGTTVGSANTGPRPDKLNPAIAKFSNPTAAEAILAALDRDLKAHDAQPKKDARDSFRQGIENSYLGALVALGDKRIAEELAKRGAAETHPRMRWNWALAGHWLGESKLLASLADDFRTGKIVPPADTGKPDAGKPDAGKPDAGKPDAGKPDAGKPDMAKGKGRAFRELEKILTVLISAPTPETDRALSALADPKHPWHDVTVRAILAARPNSGDGGPWLAHPYCLPILRRALDDVTPTGARWVIDKNMLWHKEGTGGSGRTVPALLADPKKRRDEAAERVCDQAAEKLSEIVVGMPAYHPLLSDADKRLEAIKAAFDRFAGRYKAAAWEIRQVLGASWWDQFFVPDIAPLGRTATADDVKMGKAIFQLGLKGKLADLKLPAVGRLRGEAARRVMIVQAEMGPGGEVTYGVISRDGVGTVAARELSDIVPWEKALEREK